jgi:sporulation protein YlmC with PRC-barrel domain
MKGEVENELFRCSICKEMLGVSKDLLKHLCYKHSKADAKDIPSKSIKLIKDYLIISPREIKQRLRIK